MASRKAELWQPRIMPEAFAFSIIEDRSRTGSAPAWREWEASVARRLPNSDLTAIKRPEHMPRYHCIYKGNNGGYNTERKPNLYHAHRSCFAPADAPTPFMRDGPGVWWRRGYRPGSCLFE